MDTLDGYSKAAILLMTLGEDAASEVIKNLDPKALQRIGMRITEITDVSQNDLNIVLQDFSQHIKQSGGLNIEGKIYIEKVLRKALGKDKAIRIMENLIIESEEGGLDTLKWMDPKGIANLIRGEHPQTIALILTYIDTDQGSEVLTCLPESLRADVIVRMATLENIPPGVMHDIGVALQKELSQTGSSSGAGASRKVSGVKLVADILNTVDQRTEKAILGSVSENHPELAEQIQQFMFVFDDLVHLDNRSMQEILKVVSKDQLVLALKAVKDELKELVFSNMSERAALLLKEDMEAKGPVKIREVEKAQQEILKQAKTLEEAGTISLGGKGASDALV